MRENELAPVRVPKSDAVGTLCAVLFTVLRDPDVSKHERTVYFLSELSQMFFEHGYGTAPDSLMNEVIFPDGEENSFLRIHRLYCAAEQTDLTPADIFVLLARYDAGDDENGRFGLRADGDAPPIWLRRKGEEEFSGR